MAREYRDSGIEWIGQIPKGWGMVKYKFFASSRMGETILSEDTADEGVPIYSATQGSQIFGYIKNPKLILTAGDFVIPARGNSIGCVSIVTDDVATCTQTTICSCDIHNIYNKFLYYCSLGLKEYWFRYDGSAIPQITVNQVNNNIVICPPFSEQQKIADYLDKVCGEVDEMVALQETMIEELKAYKQSVITEAVTKGLNPNVSMRDSGIDWIGEIPEHWGYIKLKSITERIGDGLHGTPIYVPDSSMYFINGNNLGKKNIEIYASTNKIDKNEFDKYYIELDLKTILISLNGTIGNLSFYNGEDIILGKSAGYIVLKDHISKEYIYYCLQADNIKEYFLLSLSGTTIGNLSLRTLRNTPIALPPLDEQRTIATYLDTKCSEIDSLIALKQAKIEDLKEYKKSVIYEYVTGKKEVV